MELVCTICGKTVFDVETSSHTSMHLSAQDNFFPDGSEKTIEFIPAEQTDIIDLKLNAHSFNEQYP